MILKDGYYVFSDGAHVYSGDFQSQMEHVIVPWDGETYDLRGMCGMPMDTEVIIQSILVVPRTPEITTATDRLGDLQLHYNGRVRFQAPAAALMNRYHGLVALAGLTKRFQLLVDPSTRACDLEPNLLPIINEPIRLRENLGFWLRHVAPKDEIPKCEFTVEVQYLIKTGSVPIPYIFKRS